MILQRMLAIFLLLFVTAYAKIPCDPESFKFIQAPTTLRVHKTYYVKISNNEEIGCAINASYRWELFQVLNNELIPVLSKNILHNTGLTKQKFNRINFLSASRNDNIFGNEYAIRVNLIPSFSFFPSYRIHFMKIALEKFNFSLAAVQYHSIENGPLSINISATRENGQPAHFDNVTWNCIKPFESMNNYNMRLEVPVYFLKPGITHNCTAKAVVPDGRVLVAKQEVIITESDKKRVLEINCIMNCHHGDPLYPTSVAYNCSGDCSAIADWKIEPYDTQIMQKLLYKGFNKQFLHIPAATFEYGKNYKVKVFFGKEFANYLLQFDYSKTNLSLICIKNCYKRHKEIVFMANCSVPCSHLQFFWEMDPHPSSWKFGKKIENTNSGQTITFPPFTFFPRTGATLNVQSLGMSGSITFTVDDYNPEIEITCISDSTNCNNPSAFKDVIISMSCLARCDVPGFYWTLTPHAKFLEKNVSSLRSITIPPDTYKPGERVKIAILVDQFEVADLTIKYAELFELELECVTNCGENGSNPFRPVMIVVDCIGACSSKFSWSTSPPSKHAEFSIIDNGTLLFLPGNMYSPGQNITVSVESNERKVFYNYFYRHLQTKIEIYCVSNCFNPTHPNINKVLRVVCVYDCDEARFEWDIEPKEEPFLWHQKIALSYQNHSITLKKNLLKKVWNITVRATVFPAGIVAEYLFVVNEPIPRVELICIKNCAPSYIHEDVILITVCSAFCFNLNYTWNITKNGTQVEANKFELKGENLWLKKNQFNDGDKIVVVLSRKFLNISETILYRAISPVLRLSCKPIKCHKPQNGLLHVTVNVTCLSECAFLPFFWYIHPPVSNYTWHKYILLGENNKSITFIPHTFRDGTVVKVTVSTYRTKESKTLIFYKIATEFKLLCIGNCNYSNPYESVHLKIDCKTLCDIDYFQWNIEKPQNISNIDFWSKLKFTPKYMNLEIPAGTYLDGDIIRVEAYGGLGRDSIIVPFVEPIPYLFLKCLRNCDYDPRFDTILEAICLKNCEVPKEYEWIIDNKNSSIQFYDRKVMVIPGETYNEHSNVSIQICKGKGCSGMKKINFKMPSFKYLLLCNVSSTFLICDANQTILNPKLETRIVGICYQNCQVTTDILWEVSPLIPEEYYNIVQLKNMSVFSIKPDKLQNGSCLQIRAYTSTKSKSTKVCYFQPTPRYKIICTFNCGYPNPNNKLILKVACFLYCEGLTYTWNISPQPRLFNWENDVILSENNHTLTLNQTIFEDQEAVLFILKTGNVQVRRTFVFTAPPPKFQLFCVPACINVSLGVPITVQVHCLKNCHNAYYKWDVQALDKSKSMLWSRFTRFNLTKTSVTLQSSIHASFFDAVLDVIVSSNKSSEARTEIIFQPRPANFTLECQENCEYALELEIIFKYICHKFCKDFTRFAKCKINSSVPIKLVMEDQMTFLVHIQAYTLHYEGSLLLSCDFEEIETSSTIHVTSSSLRGDCVVKPNVGISGLTEHNIECRDFGKPANFQVYQSYKKKSIFLLSSRFRYMKGIYLSPGNNNTIIIVITINLNYSIVYLTVDIISPVDYQWTLRYMIQLKKIEIIKLFRTKQYDKALQLMVATFNSISDEYMDDPQVDIFQNFLVNILSIFRTKIDRVQFISVLASIATFKMSGTLKFLSLRSHIAKIEAEAFVKLSNPFRSKNIHILNHYSQCLITIFKQCWGRLLEFYFNIFSTEYLSTEDIKLILHYTQSRWVTQITRNLMIVGENGFVISPYPMKSFLNSKSFNVRLSAKSIKIKRNSSYPSSLYLPRRYYHKSYVEIIMSTNYFHNAKEITMIFAHSKPPLLMDFFSNNEFNAILFSIKNEFGVDVKSNFYVFISIANNTNRSRIIDLNLSKVKFIEVGIYLPVNYTLEWSVTDENITVLAYKSRISMSDTELYGFKPKSKIYYYENITMSPFYFGVKGITDTQLHLRGLQCYTWHGNTVDWGTDGCSVLPVQKKSNYVQCNCTKASLITADVVHPDYKLSEPERLFSEKTHQSLLYYYLSICMFIIFAIFFITCCMCRKTISLTSVYYMYDNNVTDNEIYYIAVQTGLWKDSGTTSYVVIQVYGSKGVSRKHILNFRRFKAMRRNESSVFVMKTPRPLGDIKLLQIWLVIKDETPNWFCDTVIIKHAKSKRRYIFIVSRWFSLTRFPCTVQGTFKPKKSRKHIRFLSMIKTALRNNPHRFSFLTNHRTPLRNFEHFAGEIISIFIMALICLYMLSKPEISMWDFAKCIIIMIIGGEIVILVIDFFFRYTQTE